ncbi:aspartate aminotransferase, mitochondrial-like [Ctenocephalides felis]|uniref:aspartate aminotransferase, mitochondrial-like n=1 Tax=Ctenocephalides felis TaxID=7515 RepID=UPI000E6E4AF3|nr:aspartate aminotransferase, mitochondrial-like [Ctenocephalides felis]
MKVTNIKIMKYYSYWVNIPLGPPDPIIGLMDTMRKDTHKNKVDLTMGTYHDENGPHVLPSVTKAMERILLKNMNQEYLPIQGDTTFCKMSQEFAFGERSECLDDKVATVQCVSGTGALSIGGMFLSKFWSGEKILFVSKPTWPPHIGIMKNVGLPVKQYTYTNSEVKLDFKGMMRDVAMMPDKSIILLQASAHNPTGVDLKKKQWKILAKSIKQKQMLPFFDLAFQGFATGDMNIDAFPLRYFVSHGINLCVASSFSKNMGLYAERVGVLSFTTDCKEESDRIMSQLKIIIRPLYNSPPAHGARIVMEILSDEELYCMWQKDLKKMLLRLRKARVHLYKALKKQGSKKNWKNILSQIGPYYYMNMSDEHVKRLKDEFHIYVRHEGRLSLAGIKKLNVDYVAKGLHEVTK